MYKHEHEYTTHSIQTRNIKHVEKEQLPANRFPFKYQPTFGFGRPLRASQLLTNRRPSLNGPTVVPFRRTCPFSSIICIVDGITVNGKMYAEETKRTTTKKKEEK